MIVRHFQRPCHRARRLSYVLGTDLPPGTDDPRKPVVLSGEPELFARLCEKWNVFTLSHYSAVLSLSEFIDQEKARTLAEEFVDVLLPGRMPGQCLATAVLHRERGRKGTKRTGIHVFILATDLLGQRKLDVYWPARDRRRVETWQEFVNMREGWTSPKERERRREIRLSVSPPLPGSDELLERYTRKLRGLSGGVMEDTEEFASRVALAGAVGVRFDRTHRNRLRARFCVANGGIDLRVSAIAPEATANSFRNSTLKTLFPDGEYRRTPEHFRALQGLLVREVVFAAATRKAKHQVDQDAVARIVGSIARETLPRTPNLADRDETGMTFPRFSVAQIEVELSDLAGSQAVDEPEL